MTLQGPGRCPHERVSRLRPAGLGEAVFKGKSLAMLPCQRSVVPLSGLSRSSHFFSVLLLWVTLISAYCWLLSILSIASRACLRRGLIISHKGPDSQVNPSVGTLTQRVEVIQQQHQHQQIVGGMAEYWRLGATVDATKNIINSACHE
ncbi:hypothetical protein PGT21_011757 [Puccinia graminis f. sp. tritici]|uniref:Uncharacterized protein n=1 Tax=Puccinia graminis f. sp. tritici TaxID=56615 RepID=A0A5B0LTD5_PUCGR|nr:hypothetical protein PGT21_011757 [Puccinia graminis f. sp. tritici]